MSDLFGGGGTTQTNTIQSSDPWSGAQNYLKDIFGQGTDIYRKGPNLSPQTSLAQQMQTDRATAGSPLNQAAQQQNLATLRGDYLDFNKNPGVQNAMDMARTQINSQFGGDNFGNSAHQEWLGRGLMSAAAPFYESERQRQMGAAALSPTLANQDYADISQLGAVGQAKDQEPWQRLFNYQRAVSGAGGGTTATQAQNPYYSNPLASALGMSLGGLGLYNGLGAAGLLGGGAAAGGAAGAGDLIGTMAMFA